MSQNHKHSETLLHTILNHSCQGIIVLDKNYIIHMINPNAAKILGVSSEDAINRRLESICPELSIANNMISSTVTLMDGTKIKINLIRQSESAEDDKKILFLDILSESKESEILENIINSIDEAIMACDSNGRLIIYNNANQRLDKLLREQVLGQFVTNVYGVTEETSLLLKVMKERKPILDKQQNYTTCMGRNLNIVCDTYPLFQENEVIGAVSIMRDYSKVKELSDKIMDLQEALYKKERKTTEKKAIKSAKYTFNDIIGSSQSLKNILTYAERAAATDSPILIYGETGTGKELFAQSIHNASKRADEPFIAINCAAIPETLLEGILFGTVKGSFSGAIDRPGLFEQAHHGTLLLDELNSMSMGLQSKLLRVLQEGTVRRVGAITETPVDVRIITNINLQPSLAIEQQKLRQDLFYRLSVVYLKIPSLRHRKEDIPILSRMFIDQYNLKLAKRVHVHAVSPDVMDIFMQYAWPGNVREFQHAIESAMNIMDPDEIMILPKHLPSHIMHNLDHGADEKRNLNFSLQLEPLCNIIEAVEKQVILCALQRNHWNVSRTSKQLDMKRQSLQYRIKKYGIK
ncbi:sigma 54-interacting transcriptional regulator [Clostridiaceae bacterium 35-E11]